MSARSTDGEREHPRVASDSPDSALEREIATVGRSLAEAFPSAARHPLRAADTKALELAGADAELKAALFRFVDVVPACRSLEDLARHLTSYLGELGDLGEEPRAAGAISAAQRLGETRAGRTALGVAAAGGVKHMAHRFIVGETLPGALRTLRGLWRHGVASSVDLLGEATVTAAEADAYAARCRDAVRVLARGTVGWTRAPGLSTRLAPAA